MRAQRLAEDLWPGGARANTLQVKVSQLRRALGDPAAVPGGSAGYALVADAVDALDATRLAAEGAARLADGDPAAAATSCRAGLQLFDTEVLPAAGDGDWVAPHRVRLTEVRLRLTEDELAARLALGAAGELVGRAGGAGRGAPVARGAVGVAGHGAVPGGPPGRRAGRAPPRHPDAGRRAGRRPRPGAGRAGAPGARARPGARRPTARQPARAHHRAGRPRRRAGRRAGRARRAPPRHGRRARRGGQDPPRRRGRAGTAGARRHVAGPAGGRADRRRAAHRARRGPARAHRASPGCATADSCSCWTTASTSSTPSAMR